MRLFYFIILIPLFSKSQKVTFKDEYDSLDKYSYPVYNYNYTKNFNDNNYTLRSESGTGFFAEINGKLFLVTAKHVLTGKNSKCISQYTGGEQNIEIPLINDSANFINAFLNENITMFIDTASCGDIQLIPDVCIFPISNKNNYQINSFDISKYYLPKNSGNIMSFGFPVSKNKIDNSGVHFANSTTLLIEGKHDFINNKQWVRSDSSVFIDSLNYGIYLPNYDLTQLLHGFSGAPAFIQDLSNNKWVFLGVLIGIGGIDSNILFINKPNLLSKLY